MLSYKLSVFSSGAESQMSLSSYSALQLEPSNFLYSHFQNLDLFIITCVINPLILGGSNYYLLMSDIKI